MRESKVRAFKIRSYVDPKSIINNKIGQIQRAIYIYHDRDSKEGQPVQPHWHINLYLYNSRLPSEIGRWFTDQDNPNSYCVADSGTFATAVEYYLHHTEDSFGKYQYSLEDITAVKCDLSNISACDDEDASYSIICDMVDGIPLRDILRKYGKAFARYYINYRALARDMSRVIRISKDGEIINPWDE